MDLMAEMRRQRAANDQRVVDLVQASPGEFSVDQAALKLQLAPNTVRSTVNRGLVGLCDHRLLPRGP